ncbi:PH domain-containing protein [Halorubrum salsamenti]|uniref:PH domain-containing protein n=1 Tax=Halorubrum salsamenti TaxID=2583990 RepID=UPI0011A3DAE7|nr:PH domain-containing protein [Halorubrum salsamenti]
MVTVPEWLSLDAGEEVVWTGKPRLRRIVSNVASFAVWSVAAFVVAFVLTSVLNVEFPIPNRAVWGVAVLWTLLQAANPVRAYLRTKNTDYLLTDENVYKKTGVWSENVTRIGIDNIQNTQLKKNLFGNVFDYGTILLSTAGGSGVEMSIEDLDDPDELRTELRERIAQAGDRSRSEPGRGHGGVDPETIETLVDEATALRETAETVERHLQ